MYWLISWTYTRKIFLIPYGVVGATLTHSVLLVILWRPRRAFATLFIDFVEVLIFVWVTVIICLIMLMQSLDDSNQEEKRKYFFIHLNKNYIWNLIWMLLEINKVIRKKINVKSKWYEEFWGKFFWPYRWAFLIKL